MAIRKTKKSIVKKSNSKTSLLELKKKLALLRINIKAGKEKNTNAHKKLKKQIAQLLTKASQEK